MADSFYFLVKSGRERARDGRSDEIDSRHLRLSAEGVEKENERFTVKIPKNEQIPQTNVTHLSCLEF